MLKALLTSFLSIVFIAIPSAQANSYNDLVRQAERLHSIERNYNSIEFTITFSASAIDLKGKSCGLR